MLGAKTGYRREADSEYTDSHTLIVWVSAATLK